MLKGLLIIIVLLSWGIGSTFGQSKKTSTVVHPEWSGNASIYEVNIRQYTGEGTFAAFAKHLPRLKKLGVKILWFMPINPIGELNRKGTLGSYYSVKDYKAVNPEFGTIDDFKELVKKIHSMGMYVIIDWVANHTAWDNVWTKTHPEFYNKNRNGEFFPPVKGWQDVIDLNYDNKPLWEAMIDAMKFWVVQCDIDGFRCDVAAMVPTEFWNKARAELDKLKPIFMLAEASEPDLHEHAFDMTYNWELKDLMNDIAAGKKNAKHLLKHFNKERKKYPENSYRMNFTTNHDENSWNGTVYERLDGGAAAFAVLTATVPGMPLLYSGQEAGLNKRLSFFDKDTIEWKQSELENLYTKLFRLKLNNKALANGSAGGKMIPLIKNRRSDVFAFIRKKNSDAVLVVLNLSSSNHEFKIKNSEINGNYFDLFSEKKINVYDSLDLKLEPWGYKILIYDSVSKK
jgi:glycosidase